MGVIMEVRDPEKSLEEKIRAYRLEKKIQVIWTVLAIVFALVSSYLLVEMQTYTKMRTIQIHKNTSTDDVHYLQYADGVLKYSRDGIAYLDKKGVEQWNQSYQIKNPVVNISGKAVAVAERSGNDIYVMDEKGSKGEIHTNYPIEKIAVAENGIVSTILNNESSPMVVCYDATGNVLVEHRASLTGTGYPIGLALSPDGTRLQISYLCVADGVEATRIGYLNFEKTEEEDKEYQVADDIYKNEIIPTAFFVDDKKSILVGDQSFMIYEETDKPVLTKTVNLDKQVKSFFHDDEFLGFVLKDDGSDYELRLYDMEGNQKMSKTFSGEYGNVKISQGNVIMYEGTSCMVYSRLGVKRFEGTAEDEIKEMIPLLGINKYLVMNADGLEEVRLVK